MPREVRRRATVRNAVVLVAVALAARGVGAAGPEAPGSPKGRALIVVGLPGDAEHRARWAGVAGAWRSWLTGPLGFAPGDVVVLAEGVDGAKGPASREALTAEAGAARGALGPGDRLWVFWLGHASLDGDRVALHLPGPDLDGEAFGALFRGVSCREQVFWLTSAGSGWMVKALSARGRVVISATGRDQEFNETEFPEALAGVVARPPAGLVSDPDGGVSVRALFVAASDAVAARFAADGRVPTEHAGLDDDGDGVATEAPDLARPAPGVDGAAAAAVRVKIPPRPTNP